MLVEKFDPYGEALPDDIGGQAYVTKGAPALMARIGQIVFWTLAIVIVYARVRYFPAGF